MTVLNLSESDPNQNGSLIRSGHMLSEESRSQLKEMEVKFWSYLKDGGMTNEDRDKLMSMRNWLAKSARIRKR